MDLQGLIDKELDEAGFPKKAYSPWEDDQVGARTDKSEDTLMDLSEDVPGDSAVASRVQGSGKAKVQYRNPVLALKEAAAQMPMKQLLRKIAQDKAGKRLGLKTGNEVHQAFTGSDAVNHLKLAGMAKAIANLLPEELLLPLVQKFKGTKIFPHAAEAEAFLLGKGLRAAAESQDLEKARRLFESAGGVPSIDPADLLGLQMKARHYDAGPSYLSPLLGGLAGLGLGSALMRQPAPQQPAAPAGWPQIMKVGPQ